MVAKYRQPDHFLKYDLTQALFDALVDAKAGIEALRSLPYQKSWMEPLRELELKTEVAGTTKIEGATFIGEELDAAFRAETPDEARTRSQRQLIAAKRAYEWIDQSPPDYPIDKAIRDIHRLMVTGCDEDRCEPGGLRKKGEYVTFGIPIHLSAPGGAPLKKAFDAMCEAFHTRFRSQEPLLQALALHYHIGSMHPFLDGNGRCARGVEAFVLKRSGYATHGFIGLSNYYYEERVRYLEVLAETGKTDANLTNFLIFGLQGIAMQCSRIRDIILRENRIVLFKNMMYRVFRKYESRRRRCLTERQVLLLEYLLDRSGNEVSFGRFIDGVKPLYKGLIKEGHAFARDVSYLEFIRAVEVVSTKTTTGSIRINLDWPKEMTASDLGQLILDMPSSLAISKYMRPS